MTIIEVDQAVDTPLTIIRRGKFDVRFAYVRSGQSRQRNLRGGDYLVFRVEPRKMAFVYCGGDQESVFKSQQAQNIGEVLLKWLWSDSENEQSNTGDSDLLLNSLNRQLENYSNIFWEFIPQKTNSEITKVKITPGNLACGIIQYSGTDIGDSSVRLFWCGCAKPDIWNINESNAYILNSISENETQSHNFQGDERKIFYTKLNCSEVKSIQVRFPDPPESEKLEPRLPEKDVLKAILASCKTFAGNDICFLEISFDSLRKTSPDDIVSEIREKIYPMSPEQ